MSSWLSQRSVRTQIFALALAVTLPLTAMLAWFLADNLSRARSAAQREVRIIAEDSVSDLETFLHKNEATLARLAERPLIKALDPKRCDPVFSEYVSLYPEFFTLGLRDAQGNIVCSFQPNPPNARVIAHLPWFIEAMASDKFMASDALLGPTSGRWVAVLTYPVRDDSGRRTGLLALTVDLQKLSEDILGTVPKNAALRVLDRNFTTLLRAGNAIGFIGKPGPAQAREVTAGLREGFHTQTGMDGVTRLNAYMTVAGAEWRVVVGLPESDVLADYQTTLRRAIGIGFCVLLLVLGAAWRIGVVIVSPISALAGTAASIARGDKTARAKVAGPREIKSVTQQFNHMLDARDHDEATLAESELRYQTLVEWSPEAVTIHREGTVIYANPSAIKLFGAKLSNDLTGKLMMDLVHPAARQHDPLRAAQIVAGSELATTETTMLRLDGAVIDVEARSALIVYDGSPAVHTSMHDITARKRVKNQLIATKDLLQATLDAIPDLLFEVGLDGRIFDYHCHRTDLLAVPPDVFMGKTFSEVLPPAAAQICLSALREAAEQGWSAGARYALRLPQGECWFELSISVMPRQDQDSHFIVVSRDITKRKLTETRIEELSRRLVQTQEENRRRFSRELHDRTSPNLAALRINLDIIAQTSPESFTTQAFSDRVEDTRALIDDTTISIRQICAELHPPALDRGGLLGVVQSYAQQFAKRTGLQVQISCPHGDLRLAADLELGMFRIVQEAMTNCAKHAKAQKIEVRLEFDSHPMRLVISDDGCGFDVHRLEGATHRAGQGLLNMKETAEFAGGSFRVESEPGCGTRVYVEV